MREYCSEGQGAMGLRSPCQSHMPQAVSGHCQRWLPQQTVGYVGEASWILMPIEEHPCHLQ